MKYIGNWMSLAVRGTCRLSGWTWLAESYGTENPCGQSAFVSKIGVPFSPSPENTLFYWGHQIKALAHPIFSGIPVFVFFT